MSVFEWRLLAMLVLPVLLVGGLGYWFWRLSKVASAAPDAPLPTARWLGLLATAGTACLVFYGWLDTLRLLLGAHAADPSAHARQQHYDTLWWVLLVGLGVVLLLAARPSRWRAASSFGAGLLLALSVAGGGWHLRFAHERKAAQARAAATAQAYANYREELASTFYGRVCGGTASTPSSPAQIPVFPGGQPVLRQAIRQRVHYPANTPKYQFDGDVVVEFIVEADGRLTFAHVFGGIGAACDQEAVRVINSLPAFIPGRDGGHPIATIWYASVPFRRPSAPVAGSW